MKDFPINDLLSATELDRIRIALQQIFNHLRKIRSTKYPMQRALRLVEAISRDLNGQLLKVSSQSSSVFFDLRKGSFIAFFRLQVLGTRRLMHIPFDELEKVMVQCYNVFSTWDDEYEKLQSLLRDVVKKKREEQLKMVWRMSPVHKRLQTRMEHMRRFRHQHEQLRTVIVRVLRPNIGAVTARNDGEQALVNNEKQQDTSFESSDSSAIEVN